jgi:hypothetical protein
VNKDNVDFTDIEDHPPVQKFDVPINGDVGEYVLNRVRRPPPPPRAPRPDADGRARRQSSRT